MKTYTIKKINGPVTDESWTLANVAKVDYEPWKNNYRYPYHMEARLLYNDEAVFVQLQTDERPLTAVANTRNGDVFKDSCMEFFFSPDADDPHYFNFEINPLGTVLLYHCVNRNDRTVPADDEKILNIKSVITPETWTLTYQIPFSFILKYFEKISPKAHGNFYKCGDEAVVPHYATWSPVTCVEEDFHRSEFFGELIFEEGISVSR